MTLNPAELSIGDKVERPVGFSKVFATVHHICDGTVYIHEESNCAKHEVRPIDAHHWNTPEGAAAEAAPRDSIAIGNNADLIIENALVIIYRYHPGRVYVGTAVKTASFTNSTHTDIKEDIYALGEKLESGYYKALAVFYDDDVAEFEFRVMEPASRKVVFNTK